MPCLRRLVVVIEILHFALEANALVHEIVTAQGEPTIGVPAADVAVAAVVVVVQLAVAEEVAVECSEKAAMSLSHLHPGWLAPLVPPNPFFACGDFETPSRPFQQLLWRCAQTPNRVSACAEHLHSPHRSGACSKS